MNLENLFESDELLPKKTNKNWKIFSDDSKHLCLSNNMYEKNENEILLECPNCKKFYCENCLRKCHSIYKCEKIDDYKAILIVYEYASECECNNIQNYIKKNGFLPVSSPNLEINEEKISKIILEIVPILLEIGYSTTQNKFILNLKLDDLKIIQENKLLDNNFYRDFNKTLSEWQIENQYYIDYEKKDDLLYLKDFYIKILRNGYYVESVFMKLFLHSLIFKPNMNITFEQEIFVIQNLKNKLKENKYYLKKEKINIILTYIYEFYKKYLFFFSEPITIDNINLLSKSKRFLIKKHNTEYRLQLEKNEMTIRKEKMKDNTNNMYIDFGKSHFSFEGIKQFIEELISLKDFCIKINQTEKNVPFLIYLIKNFISTYSFNKNEMHGFLHIIEKIQYKKRYEEYNFNLRKSIDECFFICQIHSIDIVYESEKNENLNTDDLLKILYYHDSKTFFKIYLEKMFKDEEVYLKSGLSVNNSGRDTQNKSYKDAISNLITKDKFYYFDCFHYNFMPKIFPEKFNIKYLKKNITDNIKKKKKTSLITKLSMNHISNNFSNLKIKKTFGLNTNNKVEEQNENVFFKYFNNKLNKNSNKTMEESTEYFVSYKNFKIINFREEDFQIEELRICLDKILKGFTLDKIPPEKIKDFLNFLYSAIGNVMSQKQIEKKEDILISSPIDENFINYFDVGFFFKILDNNSGKINFKEYEEELIFIFYQIFLNEKYKSERFKSEISDKFNILLCLFLVNKQDIVYLFKDLCFLDFVLQTETEFDDKKHKISFLYNSLRSEKTKRLNFIWHFIYLCFKKVIEEYEDLTFLNEVIIKNFIYKVLNFYHENLGVSYLSQKYEKKQIMEYTNNMNHFLIYYFLKITKDILISNNLNSIYPFRFNINKFELLEKLNIITDLAFKEKFNIIDYFSSMKFFKNNHEKISNFSKREYEIVSNSNFMNIVEEQFDEKNLLNTKSGKGGYDTIQIEMNYKKTDQNEINRWPTRILTKVIDVNLANVQYLLLDILGNIYCTSDIKIYMDIIDENIDDFNEFFDRNLEKVNQLNKNDLILKDIKKFEFTILKYLLNFLTLKHYNFYRIKTVIDIEFSNEDMKLLAQENKNIFSKNNITLEKITLEGRFEVSRIKIKILDFFIKNLNKIQDFFKNEKEKIFGYYFINNFAVLFKYFKLKKNEKKIRNIYEKAFFKLLEDFFSLEEIRNMVDTYSMDKKAKEKKNLYEKYELLFYSLFETSFENYSPRNEDKLDCTTNFYGINNSNINEYFKEFILYDFKLHSVNSGLIFRYFIKNELDKDKDAIKREEQLKRNKNDYLSKNWEEIYNSLNNKNPENISNILKYLFNNLKFLEEEIEVNKSISFDDIFSENFLKIISFINNLIYYYPIKFQSYLVKGFNEKRIKILLRNLIKINNYIIEISEYERNDKLISLSKIFFILMDFFISISKGINKGVAKYFFMNLGFSKNFFNSRHRSRFYNTHIQITDNNSNYFKTETKQKNNSNNRKSLKNAEKCFHNNKKSNTFENENKDLKEIDFAMEEKSEKNSSIIEKLKKKIKKNEDMFLSEITNIKTDELNEYTEGNNFILKTDPKMIFIEGFSKEIESEINFIKKNKDDFYFVFNNTLDIDNFTKKFNLIKKNFKFMKKKLNEIIIKRQLEDIIFVEHCSKLIENYLILEELGKNCNLKETHFNLNEIYTKENFYKYLLLHLFYILNLFIIRLENIQRPYLENPIVNETILFLHSKALELKENCSNFNLLSSYDDFIGCLAYYYRSYDHFFSFINKTLNEFNESFFTNYENIQFENFLNNNEIKIKEIFDCLEKVKSARKLCLQNIHKNSIKFKFGISANKTNQVENIISEIDDKENIDIKQIISKNKNLSLFQKENVKNDNNHYLPNSEKPQIQMKKQQSESIEIDGKENILNLDLINIEMDKGMLPSPNIRNNSLVVINHKSNQLQYENLSSPPKKEKNNKKSINFNKDENFINLIEEKDEKVLNPNKSNLKEDNDDNKDEEENDKENLEDNFYYYNFSQLKNIINLINECYFKNFSHGSYRLILQFLYITRFLKEYMELDNSLKNKDNKKIKKIIDYCFTKLFDFDWILSDKIKNEKYSLLIRIGCLKLINSYLEENQNYLKKSLLNKIYNKLSAKIIFNEIVICLDSIRKEEIKERKNIRFNYRIFLEEYIIKEKIYKSELLELAEYYYKFLRYVDVFYREIFSTYEIYLKKDQGIFKKVISKMKKIGKQKKNYEINFEEKEIDYFKFIHMLGKEIEIKYINGDGESLLKKVYFFKPSRCFWMNYSLKKKFLEKTPRFSLGTKLDYINKKLDKFLLNINLSYKFTRKSNKFRIYYKNFNFYYFDLLNFLLIIAINTLMLFHYYDDGQTMKDDNLYSQIVLNYKSNSITERVNYILYVSFANFFIQIIIILIWFEFRFNICFGLDAFKKKGGSYYLLKSHESEESFKLREFNIYHNLVIDYESLDHKKLNLKKLSIGFFTRALITIKITFYNREINCIIYSLICNIIYFITNYKLILILPVFSIINLYALFDYFFKAMLNKYQEFVAIMFFIYLVMYIYGWFSFLHLQDFMISDYVNRSDLINNKNGESKKELLCSTAIECFFSYVDLSLRMGGGIGDSVPRISFKFDDKRLYFLKIFWETSFHFIVNLILQNIFFGIIVDTFNELRDQKDLIEADKANRCFMCNRYRFSNIQGDSFDEHRAVKHKIFNYIYFIPYLFKKNPQDYSQPEKFAWEQINLKKLDWFPGQIKEEEN